MANTTKKRGALGTPPVINRVLELWLGQYLHSVLEDGVSTTAGVRDSRRLVVGAACRDRNARVLDRSVMWLELLRAGQGLMGIVGIAGAIGARDSHI